MKRTKRSVAACICLLLLLLSTSRAAAIEVQTVADELLPNETREEIVTFSPKLLPLWLEALARPEADLKKQAAEAIALAAGQGMRDTAPAIPVLVEQLKAKDVHPIVRLAVVRTLVKIDARSAADLLRQQAREGSLEMAQLVEPALARWNDGPIRQDWLDRLKTPSASPALVVLAIEGLAEVGAKEAAAPLRTLALEASQTADLRLHAARALAKLQSQGLLDNARQLAADRTPAGLVDRLVAVALVAQHEGAAVETLLLELAVDPEPAVAAQALAQLHTLNPQAAAPIMERTITSPDSKVRQRTAELLFAQRAPQSVRLLARLLGDPHPELRRTVRESLIELAEDEKLDPLVRKQTMRVLGGKQPLAMEQALMVVAALDHEPAAQRAVTLLASPVPRVSITAGWALRRLAVPETAPAMLQRVRKETEASLARSKKKESIDAQQFNEICEQLHHLIEGLGVMRYRPAAALLADYLPKPPLVLDPLNVPQETVREANVRAGAVWALGQIYERSAPPKLVDLLLGRLTDQDLANPESNLVQQMAAVSLIEMKAEPVIEVLEKLAEEDASPNTLGRTAVILLARVRNETPPPFEPLTVQQRGWFLEPLAP